MKLIDIIAGNISLNAEFDEAPTANAIWNPLHIDAVARRWGGDHIYFDIPIESKQEQQARSYMSVGEIAFSPPAMHSAYFSDPRRQAVANSPGLRARTVRSAISKELSRYSVRNGLNSSFSNRTELYCMILRLKIE